MKLNSTTIQAALISAAVSAFIGLLSIGATIGIGMWQQEKTRVKQALVERRLEIAQEYYRISYKWPRARFDLATLGQISTELDMYSQGHTLYLDSPGRAMANVLVDAMRDVERSGEIPKPELQKKIQRVSELIPRFQEVLLRSVWLEDTPREKEDLLVLGV